MGDWSEINDLSNYFSKLQEETLVNRLSDNNCIEILEKLVKLNLINVIYTTDGKEFVTPKHLLKEIKEELISNGGRINIVDLASILKLDLCHIQNAVNDLIKQDSSLFFILGQLINKNYENIISDEINQKLVNGGILALNDLSKSYDLPGDYINNVVKKGLQSQKINGILDDEGKRLYTEKYVDNQISKIRGIFSAIINPANIQNLATEHKLNENLIITLLEQLIKDNELKGSIIGNKREKLSYLKYMPDIYTQIQKIWAIAFFKQNKFLEYDGLRKLNIFDPKSYVTKIWDSIDHTNQSDHDKSAGSGPLFLETCCVDQDLKSDILANIETNLTSHGFVDLMDIVPPFMSTEDGTALFELYVRDNGSRYKVIDDPTFLWDDGTRSSATRASAGRDVADLDSHTLLLMFDGTFALTRKLINGLKDLFEPTIKDKAYQASISGYPRIVLQEEDKHEKSGRFDHKVLDDDDASTGNKRDDRRKKAMAAGAKGGGTQGRETKTKSVTNKKLSGSGKKGSANRSHDHAKGDNLDDEPNPNHRLGTPSDTEAFLSPSQIADVLWERNFGRPDFFVADEDRKSSLSHQVATILYRPLYQSFNEECKKLYMSSLSSKRTENKQEFERAQESINGLHQRMITFHKGLQLFKDEKVRDDLNKYLMKTLGLELFGLIVNLQHMQNQNEKCHTISVQTLTTHEGRKGAISKFQEGLKSYLTSLNQLLTQNEVTRYLDEIVTGSQTGILNVLIKKYDKKKERLLIQNFRQELASKLNGSDPGPGDDATGTDVLGKTLENLALKFHLSVITLFLDQTRCPLHASGKFVPNVVDYLLAHPSSTTLAVVDGETPIKDLLQECQKLIIDLYSSQHSGEEISSKDPLQPSKAIENQAVLVEKLAKLQSYLKSPQNKPNHSENIAND